MPVLLRLPLLVFCPLIPQRSGENPHIPLPFYLHSHASPNSSENKPAILNPVLRYAITDRLSLAPDEPTRQKALLAQAAHLAASGIDFLQLREKDLPAADLLVLARALQETLQQTSPHRAAPTRLLINARPDIALAAGAAGVHLTSAPGELHPAQIRTLYATARAPRPTISVSCHTLADIERILRTPQALPDLILFGPVFEKRVRGELLAPGAGLEQLAHACRLAAPIPVLALGGLTQANTPDALAAGAAGIAAIRAFASG